MRQIVTQSECARLRGVSPAAVARAIADGRIVPVQWAGKQMIDVEAADLAWTANTQPRIESAGSGRAPADLRDSRAAREAAHAELMRLKADRARGELIERNAVLKDMADAVAVMLSSWESLPDRVAPLIAGVADPQRVRDLVREEVEKIQAQIYEQLGELAPGEQLAGSADA